MGDDSEEKQIEEESVDSNEREDVFESAAIDPKHIMITDEELRTLKKESADYKDKYLRLLADGENARKRMQKERQDLTRYAIENVIVDFLPPLDNLENALGFAQNMSDEVKNWAFGFQMILTQFKDVLSRNGVTAIESQGTHFDPHLHEAVEMVESDSQLPGTIIEVCVGGYRMGDRTIRPARVKVVKNKLDSDESQTINQENENI